MRITMDLAGKKILVVGLGKTGIATARFLAGQGAMVTVTDEKPLAEWEESLREIGNLHTNLTIGVYGTDSLLRKDMVIPSPGVPPFNLLLSEAVRRKIPVLSEIELAFQFLRRPMIAITGTNGKTTTATLMGEILKRSGKKTSVMGNIGEPLIGYVEGTQNDDYVVVEVSSFQLQWIQQFRPFIAILLNATCDHVNYHGTFEEYCRVKERIFENQTTGDIAILNADDVRSESLSKRIAARVRYFSSSSPLRNGMFFHGCSLVYCGNGKREEYPLAMVKIPGRHNIENIMATVIAARECGCSPDNIIATVEDFKGVPHRIEFAGEKNGVAFYDDSKGTNVGAVMRALETFSQPIILLMGGRDKEGDFKTLIPLVKEKVKGLLLFGEARERINTFIGGAVKTVQFATLGEAIEMAWQGSSAGDIVLLSPGCASFDEFSDYRARGKFFKEAVGNL
ncbi:MAG: UDP-N-acetylmuramoyl-L-alanine--D-glutamate ligase [Syntrophales bacterium]|nr:UDP-N-acetylmuramoyl-L-alanine--D-glutamate ligase [Syntrophales bacterium]